MATWKELLENGYHDIRDLAQKLGISEDCLPDLCNIQEMFPMYVNPYYLSLIDMENPEDPIRKMCIPSQAELQNGGTFDTSGEQDNTVLTGMQHKYAATVLILSTNRCAMYCRHCFRKRLVGLSENEIAKHVHEMAEYVRSHEEINNVLISGGDAFLNSNQMIKKYLDLFTSIPHIDCIRFGTRTPVVLPQRMTTDKKLLELLADYSGKKQIYVITHFNHPKEITEESALSIRLLTKAGVIVRNQTVLLKGINDNSQTLGTLLRRLVSIGVLPYYIFQCRPVVGVKSHFQVPLHEGYNIVEGAKNMQNGLGKSVRYVMSHVSGKIEILGGLDSEKMLFKYHQAKYPKDAGRIFTAAILENQCWLD